mmetsp:Transcript_29992/g.42804  ORF Transcript_29992/g.42804 Transcript_29992/m.42804 type:complete len:518 (+) Transcript_29992:43-1596(+)
MATNHSILRKNIQLLKRFHLLLPELQQLIFNFLGGFTTDSIAYFKINGPFSKLQYLLWGFPALQNPTIFGTFGLRGKPWWDKEVVRSKTTVLSDAHDQNNSPLNITQIHELLEKNASVISQEFTTIRNNSLSTYECLKTSPNSKGEWIAYYFMEEGFWDSTTISMCPLTHAILKELPICVSKFGYIYFSVLSPHTSIDTHCGVTNTKLRIQLPLQLDEDEIKGFPECYLTVNNDTRQYFPEKAIIFDDSFAHSVCNNGSTERVVLLIDIWHPSLSQSSIAEISNLSGKEDIFDEGHISKFPTSIKKDVQTPPAYDFLLKIVVAGERGSGKSKFVLRWADDEYDDTYLWTIGVDFRIRTLKIRNSLIKVQLWDYCTGPERFRTISRSFYRGARIILIMADVTDALFYKHAEYHIKEISGIIDADTQTIVLVGTKIDCVAQRQVSFDEAQSFATERGIYYFETSSKTGAGIQEGVRHVIKSYLIRGLRNGTIQSMEAAVPKVVNTQQTSTKSRKTCTLS